MGAKHWPLKDLGITLAVFAFEQGQLTVWFLEQVSFRTCPTIPSPPCDEGSKNHRRPRYTLIRVEPRGETVLLSVTDTGQMVDGLVPSDLTQNGANNRNVKLEKHHR